MAATLHLQNLTLVQSCIPELKLPSFSKAVFLMLVDIKIILQAQTTVLHGVGFQNLDPERTEQCANSFQQDATLKSKKANWFAAFCSR